MLDQGAPLAPFDVPLWEARERHRRKRLGMAGAAALLLVAAAAGLYGVLPLGALQPTPKVQAIERQTLLHIRSVVHNRILVESRTEHDAGGGASPARTSVRAADLRTAVDRMPASPAGVMGYAGILGYRASGGEQGTAGSPRRTALAVDPLSPASSLLAAPGPRRQLAFELVGRQAVDGKPTFHLRAVIPVDGGTYFAATWTAEVWIDESTYLPVRSTMTNDERTSQVTDFTWLPRTNASLTKYGLRGNMPIQPGSKVTICDMLGPVPACNRPAV